MKVKPLQFGLIGCGEIASSATVPAILKSKYAKVVAAADGRMLGCQLAGQAEIAGRLNHAALAVCRQMHLEEFISAETGYNPALAPIFDPLQVAAEICLKKIKAGHE